MVLSLLDSQSLRNAHGEYKHTKKIYKTLLQHGRHTHTHTHAQVKRYTQEKAQKDTFFFISRR